MYIYICIYKQVVEADLMAWAKPFSASLWAAVAAEVSPLPPPLSLFFAFPPSLFFSLSFSLAFALSLSHTNTQKYSRFCKCFSPPMLLSFSLFSFAFSLSVPPLPLSLPTQPLSLSLFLTF